jgi:hypothetical protein
MPKAKAYLRARQLRNPMKARVAIQTAISEFEDLRIKTALGQHLGRRSRIVLVRPWWMPNRFYTWLLSTVVSETQ